MITRRLAVTLALLCSPVSARAQQPPPRVALRLEYSRGPRTICPDEHAVAELLRGAVDYEAREDADLRVVVETTRVGRQHRAKVVLLDRSNRELWSREHEHPDCTDALLSGVVSTALGLVNLKLPVAPALPPVAPSAPAPPVVAQPVPVVPPPPAAPIVAAPPPFDVLMGADLVFGMGTTPIPSLGLGVFVAMRPAAWPALTVEVTGRASWSLGAAQVGYVPVRSTFYSGQLALCGHARFVFFCPTLGAGALENHALTPTATETDAPRGPFAIVGVRLGAVLRAQRFTLHGFLELEGLPGGATITLNGHEQWRASFGGAVGVGGAWQP